MQCEQSQRVSDKIFRGISAFVCFASSLLAVSGALTASPLLDHVTPGWRHIPPSHWQETLYVSGVFHLLLWSGAAMVVAVYASKGTGRTLGLLVTATLLGAYAGSLSWLLWIGMRFLEHPMLLPGALLSVAMGALGAASVACSIVRARELRADEPGWFC